MGIETQPLLSIVIANYNYGRFIGEAIESVLAQSCQDYELIICDGGSKDNSVDVIKKYADHIAWWCSEPDGGQSAAFNKGFAHAKGRFLTWLNADDVMLPGTIARLSAAVVRDPSQEWWIGGVMWLDKSMKILQCRRAEPMSRIETRSGHVGVWGPSSFFTKSLFDKVGGVDERFHYTMDMDLWHKFAYIAHKSYKIFSPYAWGLRLHEDAKMSGQNFDSAQKDPSHPRWKQIRQETEWMELYYKPKSRMTKLKRLLSLSWPTAIMSRFESWRYKGVPYMDFFGKDEI